MNSVAKYMQDNDYGSMEAIRRADTAQDQAVRALNELIERATRTRDALIGDDIAAWNQALRDWDGAGASGTLQSSVAKYVAAVSYLTGVVQAVV